MDNIKDSKSVLPGTRWQWQRVGDGDSSTPYSYRLDKRWQEHPLLPIVCKAAQLTQPSHPNGRPL